MICKEQLVSKINWVKIPQKKYGTIKLNNSILDTLCLDLLTRKKAVKMDKN